MEAIETDPSMLFFEGFDQIINMGIETGQQKPRIALLQL